MFKGHNKYLI